MKCEWCKCEFEGKHQLRKYCDFCQKHQNVYLNTETKLNKYIKHIYFFLDYVEDIREINEPFNERFYPEDLIEDGVIKGIPMSMFDELTPPTIPIGEVKLDLSEDEEYRAISEFEYQLIRRLENVNPRPRISTTS